MARSDTKAKSINSSNGFTVIELLIVIVIIGILVAIVAVGYNSMTRQAKEASLKSDLKNAATQLSVDHAKTGIYPGTDGIKTDGGSLSKSPGTTFQYTRSGNGTAYCLTATTPGVPAFMVSSDNTAPREGTCPGHTEPSTGGGGDEIANNTPIQDITKAQCEALPTYTGSNETALRAVTDSRGGTTRSYRIGKLADGNCWMLDNLKLGSTTGTITLTSSDTNLTNKSSFTLPQLVTTAGSSSYDDPRAYGPVPGDTSSGDANYGYLYNWPSATAGESRTTHGKNAGDAPNSICPANWRMPRSGYSNTSAWPYQNPFTTNDFANLDKAFGGTGTTADSGQPNIAKWQYTGPFRGLLSGAWYSGFSLQSSNSNMWSSSAHPVNSYVAFYADLNPSYVSPGEDFSRDSGYAIRCLLK